MNEPLTFREFVAITLLALFTYVLIRNPHDNIIIGALLTAFAAAWGYYLGGSKVGADTATKNADTVAAQAAQATDTAGGTPQAVTVVNAPDEPVPTTTEARP